MVGIFEYRNGLHFVAVSKNEESAINYLFNKYANEWDKKVYTPLQWWKKGKKENNGAPRCYEIKNVETWE